MASISRRPNGMWRPRYRDENGKEHARHFRRKIDAQRWLDEQAAALLTGTHVDPRAGKVTFRQFAEDWRATQVLRPSTATAYERILRASVYPRIGERPLSSIRSSDVQSLVSWLVTERGLAPRSVRVALVVTSSVFKAAVLDRRVGSNPCAGVKLPETHKVRVQPLTTGEVASLIDAMPPGWRALVVLGAGTGVRPGEALGVTVDRIDFLRRTLLVDRQLLALPRQPPALAPVKTKASVRTIPLPQVVVDELAAHLAANPARGNSANGESSISGPQDGLLFPPMPRSTWSTRVWRPAVKAAGLPTGTGFHALRHYYASLLIRHGESVKVVQERLGHSSAAMTLDIYSHLWPDSDDRTRAAVDDVLRPDLQARPSSRS